MNRRRNPLITDTHDTNVQCLEIKYYCICRVDGLICLLVYVNDCTAISPHEFYLINIIDIAKFLHYIYNHIISGYMVQNIFRDMRYS